MRMSHTLAAPSVRVRVRVRVRVGAFEDVAHTGCSFG